MKGGRMMEMSEGKFTAKDIAEKPDLFLSGHRACAGCAPATVLRLVMKATRGPTIVTNATGCMEVSSTIYPYTSWAAPWLHTAFETAGSNASGIEAALKVLRKKGRIKDQQVDVVAFAGDGGTYDIGIQALSGAVERGHDFLFVLYDNEAYMNTGIQRSGGTPYGASTTTSQAGTSVPGKLEQKKPIADIMVAHDMPYVATASPYYWKDLITKARKGIEVNGPCICTMPKGMAKRIFKVDRTLEARCGDMCFPIMGSHKRTIPTVSSEQSDSVGSSEKEAGKGVPASSGTI
jgi:pyruvate ferredoxin oxidoreductase beta subunit